MVRPGPKTTQEEVKTAVVGILQEHPEGLNFNQIFKDLKGKKVLGSFSVLSRAMKDLCKAGIVEYEEIQLSRYKIPKRVYRLAEIMEREFKQLYIKLKEEQKIKFEEFILEKQLLHSVFQAHVYNLIAAYRTLLHEDNPSDENAKWKFLLNWEVEFIYLFMLTAARAVSEGKVTVEKAEKVACKIQKELIRKFDKSLLDSGVYRRVSSKERMLDS